MPHTLLLSFLARFFLIGLLTTTSFRLLYSLRYGEHLTSATDWATLFLQGLRVDIASLCMLISVPVLIWIVTVAVRRRGRPALWMKWWPAFALTVLVFFELPTIAFIEDYNTRPNYLMFDYLRYPQEVLGMLWGDYRFTLLGTLIALPLAFLVFLRLFRRLGVAVDYRTVLGPRRMLTQTVLILVVFVPLMALGMRSSLQHRPLNPSLVAFSEDPLVNQLVLNSAYSASYSQYMRSRYDKTYKPQFDMPAQQFLATVKGSPDRSTETSENLSADTASTDKNIVVLLQESLGAEFVGRLGGQKLTPELDKLSEQGIWFDQLYATGTRSARGIEAVISGFLPTASEAVLKRPQSQHDFFTFACLARQRGYETIFVYGGEAHFDNMKAFLLNNCFDRAVDKHQFTDPAFVGSWGVSDEDMYDKVDELLTSGTERPKFVFAFTVSNHSPWEYPEGRITLPDGEQHHTREATVRYADHALGEFFTTAKQRPYWQDSLFLIVADHNSRVYGADQFPFKYFHIPGLILGAGITPTSVPHLCSQIDMLPTLLALAGIENNSPAPGRDVLAADFFPRAVMQYYETFAYLEQDILTLIGSDGVVQHLRRNGDRLDPISDYPAELAPMKERAIAYHLWPEYIYRQGNYNLKNQPLHKSFAAADRPDRILADLDRSDEPRKLLQKLEEKMKN